MSAFRRTIAAAVAATVLALPAAAQSQVAVFGLVDAGLAVNKLAGSGARKVYVTSGSMTTSTFGVRGTESLGGGWNAYFEASPFFSLKTGAIVGGTNQQNLFGRSAFVGISSPVLGAIDIGRGNNPSFLPTLRFNAFGNSGGWGPLWHATYFNFTQYPSFAGVDGLIHDTAWDGQVHYTSPNLAGATVNLHYAPGEIAGRRGVANRGANILYQNGALGLAAYYQHTAVESSGGATADWYTRPFDAGAVRVPTNSATTSHFAGASYDFGPLKAFATWQRSRQEISHIRARTAQASVAIPARGGRVLAEVARTRYAGPAAAAETLLQEAAIGYDYPLSRRTDVYANYLRSRNSHARPDGYTAGAGIRHQF
ncbi:porin [Massilia dura]|uniref:Porin n=1 Tax=Pseudoduganella dura TaxID=321982 RepID=A0A6I3XGV1_9BURK|nr:porin [Pseudoduganella dura]MUI15727.1 porin [Pseudoduganella dura]GGX88935.1 porin [Pseudoduganella dura]